MANTNHPVHITTIHSAPGLMLISCHTGAMDRKTTARHPHISKMREALGRFDTSAAPTTITKPVSVVSKAPRRR